MGCKGDSVLCLLLYDWDALREDFGLGVEPFGLVGGRVKGDATIFLGIGNVSFSNAPFLLIAGRVPVWEGEEGAFLVFI